MRSSGSADGEARFCLALGSPTGMGWNQKSMGKHNTINYVELKALNVPEAKKFYAAAFDFAFTDYGPNYAGIQGEDGEQGGITLAPEVKRGGPLVVLYSERIEETRRRVQDAGGTICVDIFEFPGGHRFHFLDPSGNELAVWSDK